MYIDNYIYRGAAVPKVMLYLDDDVNRAMRRAAVRAGLPYSRWVAGLIRQAARTDWPDSFLALAGAFPDAPLVKDIRADEGPDLPRTPL